MSALDMDSIGTEAESRLLAAMGDGDRRGSLDRYRAADGSRILVVSGVVFKETLNLTSMSLPSLVLRDCRLETLVLDHSHAPMIEFQQCRTDELSARGLVIDGDLIFDNITAAGMLDLCRARIGGRLVCRAVSIADRGGGDSDEEGRTALSCTRIKVSDDVDLYQCDLGGEVDFAGSEIGGTFTCTGRLAGRSQVALRCRGVQVGGSLRGGDPDDDSGMGRLEILGEVSLSEANVAGDVNFTNARIAGAQGTALDARDVVVGGDIDLNEGFEAYGLVQLVGARVSGTINCAHGFFQNRRGPAIAADGLVARELRCTGARIRAEQPGLVGAVAIRAFSIKVENLFLDFGCDIRGGGVQLVDARVSAGAYFALGCRVEAPHGTPAINADGGEFGSFFLQGCSIGEVSLRAAVISSELNCTNGHLQNPQGYALLADRLTCGDVYLSGSFVAEGMVSLWGATLGALDCRGGTIQGTDSIQRMPRTKEGNTTYALTLARAQIKQHVLAQGLTVEGGVFLADANISGNLDFTDARITPTEKGLQGTLLNGRALAVGGTLRWQLAIRALGKVDMSGAVVGGLQDSAKSWPEDLSLDGFRFGDLEGEGVEALPSRLCWLASANEFSPWPYDALISYYRKGGREAAARKVCIERERRRHLEMPIYRQLEGWVYDLLLGYGYRLWRVILILPVLYAITVPAVQFARHQNAFVPAKSATDQIVTAGHCTHDYPCLSVWAYPVDFIVPVLNLHQSDHWQVDASRRPGRIVRNWLYIATLLGWAATSFFVGALTGLVRKD